MDSTLRQLVAELVIKDTEIYQLNEKIKQLRAMIEMLRKPLVPNEDKK